MLQSEFHAWPADIAVSLKEANAELDRLEQQHKDGIKAVQARLQNQIKGQTIIFNGNGGKKIRARIQGIVEWSGMLHFHVMTLPRNPRYDGDSKSRHVWPHQVITVEEQK